MAIPIHDVPGDDFPGGGGTVPVYIITDSLTSGNQGSTYFEYLDAGGGYPPYVWSVISGTLPTGITLDGSGVLSGVPTVAGTYTFTIKVVDGIGGFASKAFTLQIGATGNPTITTISLPPVNVGGVYSQTVVATGGTTPYTAWSILTGTLPPGLSINSSGVISGTATTAGNYSFVVQVEDSASNTGVQSLSILVKALNPTITTTSISNGTSGVYYNSIISATGGTIPYTNWSVTSGILPPGLLLSGSPTTASLSGIPITAGSYVFTITVTDSGTGTDSQIFTVIIGDGNIPTISTTQLDTAQLNVSYTETISASGGSLPYLWSIESGNFPVGLHFDINTGSITGTPTVLGSYVFTVKVTDYNGNTDTQLLSITVGNFLLPSITTNSLNAGITAEYYSQYIQGYGGTLPYNWAIIGTLPTGLTVNVDTGEISGIPTVAGTYTFSAVMQDGNSNIDVQSFSIEIGDGTLPLIITSELSKAEFNVGYTQSLLAKGGVPSYQWVKVIGSLPPGLSISTNGIISGIPTSIGAYHFTVQVKDSSNSTDTKSYTLIVTSTGYSSSCCFCVFTNDIVDFTTNSDDGVLTASGGTVLNSTKWQAPSIPGIYNIEISVQGINGTIRVFNNVNVIQKLELFNTPELIDFLLPGDTYSLGTNYPSENVVWETLNSQIPLTTINGNVVINTSVADKCFGAVDMTLRGTLNIDGICGDLESYVDVRIIVNPIYPTPDNCGPEILKWLRETKDFRVLKTEFEGGCDETHIRNRIPTIRWTVNYDGLRNYDYFNICDNFPNCKEICGCNNIDNISSILPGCHPFLKSSNRLDDFWNLVYGEYKAFTLIDHDTGEIWYNVKFDDKMSTDHRHRRSSTSRNVKLVWRPCCASAPAGGTCSKHGISNYTPSPTARTTCSVQSPSVPQMIHTSFISSTVITLNWMASCSRYGIGKYEILINNQYVYNVENRLTYTFTNLNSNTEYTFSIRTCDVFGNCSEWSIPIKVFTLPMEICDTITDGGDTVTDSGSIVVDCD